MIPAVDISQYQGAWGDYPADIVMIKMSGGDAGLYMDSQAANNYNKAKAAGKHVGGYHFAGGTDPVAEANYFMRAMSPLAENDVYALDWEISHANPVSWCLTFMQTIHAQIGVWPLIYMNLSTLNNYDWSPVLLTCGLWLADWAVPPSGTIPTQHTYVMQQYSDGPNYDHDEWFGTLAEFDAYGYHSPTPPSAPTQNPTPVTPTPTSGQGSVNSTPVITLTEPPATITTPPTSTPTTPQTNTNQTNTTQDGGTPLFFSQKTPPKTPSHIGLSSSGSWWSGILNIVLAIIGKGWLWGKTK